LSDKLTELAKADIPQRLKDAISQWQQTKIDGKANRAATDALVEALGKERLGGNEGSLAKEILSKKEYLVKKSNWIIGGDGWAYDIGFGGLDHVIASGADINILVLDTEVYSNTGGQASKSTQTGAVAQFAASGKVIKKKDLASIAMSYGYVYVAQVAMGADFNQCVKAISEAESYPGPSIIIAYAPCINHGIKQGMSNTQQVMKNAVSSGYWHLFRFDPRLSEEGKNPFQLDSKEPTGDYKEFIMNEVRYSSLMRKFPDKAPALYEKAGENAKRRYEQLVKLREYYEKNK
jgi:pyruvate-ferredoxin/flavodoxin oxidoreductase